ncbi:MAG: aldo/keto reductase [Propionibacterium acidifaciens]|uniref:aldo/keto reductase n=1 Tax=Propionibacterium acidifaciens TaxID=556499 RepID=UPI00361A95AC
MKQQKVGGSMKKRRLGSLEVSEIGMGCMGLSPGYGRIPPEEESVATIRAAYDAGCTFFDTAEGYGAALHGAGHNEKLLGDAVQGFRDSVTLATKFHFTGDAPEGTDGVESCIRDHLARSLKNLRTDHVDLYYLHRVNRGVPVQAVADVMSRLIGEGLIRRPHPGMGPVTSGREHARRGARRRPGLGGPESLQHARARLRT